MAVPIVTIRGPCIRVNDLRGEIDYAHSCLAAEVDILTAADVENAVQHLQPVRASDRSTRRWTAIAAESGISVSSKRRNDAARAYLPDAMVHRVPDIQVARTVQSNTAREVQLRRVGRPTIAAKPASAVPGDRRNDPAGVHLPYHAIL